MVKKIRLIDDEPVEIENGEESTTEPLATGGFTAAEREKILEYANAIDWKLWEIMKLLENKD